MNKVRMSAALLLLALLTACNTFEGFGQDVQKGGENIEESADRNK